MHATTHKHTTPKSKPIQERERETDNNDGIVPQSHYNELIFIEPKFERHISISVALFLSLENEMRITRGGMPVPMMHVATNSWHAQARWIHFYVRESAKWDKPARQCDAKMCVQRRPSACVMVGSRISRNGIGWKVCACVRPRSTMPHLLRWYCCCCSVDVGEGKGVICLCRENGTKCNM